MRRLALFLVVFCAGCGKKPEPAPASRGVVVEPAAPEPPPLFDLSLVPAGVTILSIDEPAPTGDPLVAGKPISAWRKDLSNPNDAVAATAMRVLLASGPPVSTVPELLQARAGLHQKGYETRELLAEFGPTTLPGLVTALKSPSREARESAALVIGRSGPAAARAVPALIAAAAATDNFNEFSAILSALEQIGPVSKAAVPMLTTRLKDKQPMFRWAAARTLALLGITSDEVYAALIEPFAHPDGFFHCSASVLPLLLFGEKGLAVITTPSNWGRPLVSLEFTNSLPKLGERAGPIVAHYVAQLGSSDDEEIKSACSALEMIGRPASPAVSRLVDVIRTRPQDCCTKAIAALGKVAPDGRVAVPVLAALIGTPNEFRAIVALGAIGELAKPDVITALKPLLAKPESEEAQRAALELLRFAPEVEELYPALVVRNRYSNFPLKHVTKESLSGLRKVLTSENRQDRVVAAQAVCRLDPNDETARRIVLASDWIDADESGRSPIKRIRPGIAAALVVIGKDAVDPLAKLLNDPDVDVRASAAQTLGRIGPAAKAAVLALRSTLGSPLVTDQLAAGEALAQIEPTDRTALPVLLELAKPENREKLNEIPSVGAPGAIDRLATTLWTIDPETAVKSGVLAAGNVIR